MGNNQSTPLIKLLGAEWAAGIFGLRLFISCIAVAAFTMGTVWVLGGGLSAALERSSTTMLGGDVAIETNVPLPGPLEQQLASLGALSKALEFRSSGIVGDDRNAIEVKGVDDAYPLYGTVVLESGRDLHEVLSADAAIPQAVVERALLSRTGGKIGDTVRIGDNAFVIADVLEQEPDRLSARRFMVGPRVLVDIGALRGSDLLQQGAIVQYHYRIGTADRPVAQLVDDVSALRPEMGWEMATVQQNGNRAVRVVQRTTTFLGIAGIVALMIGLSGAWAGAKSWIQRRSRTIALYRLSGASPGLVYALHALILSMAAVIGLLLGLVAALGVAFPILGAIASRLHVPWESNDLLAQLAVVIALFATGLVGTGLLALSGITKAAPGTAMRSGEAPLQTDPRHVLAAAALLIVTLAGAAVSLPVAALAGAMALGFVLISGILACAAVLLSRALSRRTPRGFLGTVVCQTLGNPGQTAAPTVAIGIGIIGITAIVAAQTSLNAALTSELPDRVPDLVLIDVQQAQVGNIRSFIDGVPALGSLQADPMMRMTITRVNDLPAQQALVNPDKSWVIEGDRSFSWTAAPTGAELLQGSWWPEDYSGPPLVSPEEDVMEAFDLKVGDTITYSVLGRVFTSEVSNIRKEYHRTFRPEYLMVASPQPFQNAPHTWVMSLQSTSDGAVDELIAFLKDAHPNVTSIDIRTIVTQMRGVVEGATMAVLFIALLLVVAAALSVAALVASDVDARRREALVFTLIGASRREIALVRLTEAAGTGALAAIIGGCGGLLGGYFLVTEGLNIEWAPTYATFLLPIGLGIAASLVAGIIGGLGAMPKGRGQMARLLTS